MTRRVDWSDEAAEDFDELVTYIAMESPSAAKLTSDRILTSVEKLGDIPTGHPGRVEATYEKLVQKTPYIVAYQISDYTIYVARIIHGARDWPEGEWPTE